MAGSSPEQQARVEIGIVGGGIVGLILAIGLIRRNVSVRVFEQSRSFREIGAGIGWTANTVRCMGLIDPAIQKAHKACGAVALSQGNTEDQNDYLRYIDGYNRHPDGDEHQQKLLYRINAGYQGLLGCRRDQLLESLVPLLPPGTVELRKRLQGIQENGPDGKVRLSFADGTSADVDAVIGCDGIKSKVREYLFGADNPASYPGYTHVFAYRSMIPMSKAEATLGKYKAYNQHLHVGPGAHVLHYPIANNTVINFILFVHDPNPWPDTANMVAPASRADVEADLAGWNPVVRKLASLLPDKLDKWAVFDTWDHPAPFFSRGKICVAGDAAHASSPHHGTGACFGVEDSLCLSVLMEEVVASVRENAAVKGQALASALAAYDVIRPTRSQWLVNSSRRVCDMYQNPEWADPAKWIKAKTCFEELKDRSYKIWHFDYDGMMRDSVREYRQRKDGFRSASEAQELHTSTSIGKGLCDLKVDAVTCKPHAVNGTAHADHTSGISTWVEPLKLTHSLLDSP